MIILHPSGFSRASRPAFRQAVAMAKTKRAQLLILHVVELSAALPGGGSVPAVVYRDLQQWVQSVAQKRLNRVVGQARGLGVRANGLLQDGIPYQQIVKAARSKHADMIVMATHGWTGLLRILLGSVASRVVMLAPCPVLTVRSR